MELEPLYVGGTKIEPYQRPAVAGQVEAHVIENWKFDDDIQTPETSKDPAWIRAELQKLYDDAEELLGQLQRKVNENLNANWSDFKDEARVRRIAESIVPVADRLQMRLTGEITKAFGEIDRVDAMMLAASDPKAPVTVPEAITMGFRGMELRNYLRTLDFPERTKVVQDALDKGQFWIFTEALNVFPAVLDNDVVKDLRQKYALARFPWLAAMRKDAEIKAHYVLARARKIGGIGGYAMLYRQLKMDYQAPPEAQAVWDKTGRLNPEDWLAAQDDHAAVLKKIAERR
jgi:hypothetical protein